MVGCNDGDGDNGDGGGDGRDDDDAAAVVAAVAAGIGRNIMGLKNPGEPADFTTWNYECPWRYVTGYSKINCVYCAKENVSHKIRTVMFHFPRHEHDLRLRILDFKIPAYWAFRCWLYG